MLFVFVMYSCASIHDIISVKPLKKKKSKHNMLVNPITGVRNGCRHRKGTELMVEKFICIQNQKERLVLVKQYKSNQNLDRCF